MTHPTLSNVVTRVPPVAGSSKPRRVRLEKLSEAEGAAWGGFLRAHARLTERLSAELEAEHRLSLREYDVLRQVATAPDAPVRMAALAERVMLSRPGLTGVAKRLEALGLIERAPTPEDARGACVDITGEGWRRLRAAHRTHLRSIRKLFTEPLTEAELDQLGRAWQKLRDT